MRVLAIGTCRIYGAAALMPRARRFPHRVHNPVEIERAVDLLQGRDHPADLDHVLSERSLAAFMDGPEVFRETLEPALAQLRTQNFEAYAIEVSSLRTHRAASDAGPVLVDSVVARSLLQNEDVLAPLFQTSRLRRLRDLTVSPDPPVETKAAMGRIKERLARPIVWISHCGLPKPRPGEENLATTRRLLSDKVARYSAAMGDAFFDPTALVARYGREALFMNNGEDLDHYTDFGHAELARVLKEKLAILPPA